MERSKSINESWSRATHSSNDPRLILYIVLESDAFGENDGGFIDLSDDEGVVDFGGERMALSVLESPKFEVIIELEDVNNSSDYSSVLIIRSHFQTVGGHRDSLNYLIGVKVILYGVVDEDVLTNESGDFTIEGRCR